MARPPAWWSRRTTIGPPPEGVTLLRPLRRGVAFTFPSGQAINSVVSVVVQAAFGKGAASKVDEFDWVDISSKIWSVDTNRPSSRNLGALTRYQSGTAKIVLDNQDRRFDPTNLAGPYVSGGATQLVPMVPVRVVALVAGVRYPLFRGFADQWQATYIKRNKQSRTVLTATDGFKPLARFDGPAQAAQGDGELSGARMHRILDNAGWSADLRSIDIGRSAMQATTLAQPALTDLLLTADSEQGEVFIDANGVVVFNDRYHKWTASRSTAAQATWGDGVGELHYADPTVTNDDKQIFNQINIGRAGGTVQTAEDATSQATYLTSSINRTDLLLQTDTEAADYAAWLLSALKDPSLRIEGIRYSPGSSTEQATSAPVALGAQIADRWTVKLTPPGGGARISRDVWIAGMGFHFEQSHWEATFRFQAADQLTGFILDDPVYGLLDTSVLAY